MSETLRELAAATDAEAASYLGDRLVSIAEDRVNVYERIGSIARRGNLPLERLAELTGLSRPTIYRLRDRAPS